MQLYRDPLLFYIAICVVWTLNTAALFGDFDAGLIYSVLYGLLAGYPLIAFISFLAYRAAKRENGGLMAGLVFLRHLAIFMMLPIVGYLIYQGDISDVGDLYGFAHATPYFMVVPVSGYFFRAVFHPDYMSRAGN
jgi:hypothetical protein